MPSGGEIAIVDTGPLYATVDADDANHRRSLDVLERGDLRLITTSFVVAEAAYLIGTRLGANIEATFLESLAEFEVYAPTSDEWSRIAELVRQYGDFPLGATDASVMVRAERFGTDLIITLDWRHFRAVRPRHHPVFRLLPD